MYNKNMLIKRAKYFIFSLFYAIMNAGNAYAEEVIGNPIKAKSFADVVKGVAEILIKVGLPLAAIFIVWSGFLFVSARGAEDQLKKAKETFKWTILGTALIVGAYAIAEAVIQFARQL